MNKKSGFTRTPKFGVTPKGGGFTLIEVVLAIAVGLIIIAGVAVGYNYAKKAAITDSQRTELDKKFENGDIPNQEDSARGDKPTESQFNTLIDSSVNIHDDKPKPTNPSNLSPQDKTEFSLEAAMKDITFKWKLISPKPTGTVTYRLKVWQLMQGQSGKEAMTSNKPLYTLDVDGNGTADALTDGLLIIRSFLTGPCKPPYLCDFIWNVEASMKQVGTVPKTIGASEPFTFSVKEATTTPGASPNIGSQSSESAGTR